MHVLPVFRDQEAEPVDEECMKNEGRAHFRPLLDTCNPWEVQEAHAQGSMYIAKGSSARKKLRPCKQRYLHQWQGIHPCKYRSLT